MPVTRKARGEESLSEIHCSDLRQAWEAEPHGEMLRHCGFVFPLTAQGKSRPSASHGAGRLECEPTEKEIL